MTRPSRTRPHHSSTLPPTPLYLVSSSLLTTTSQRLTTTLFISFLLAFCFLSSLFLLRTVSWICPLWTPPPSSPPLSLYRLSDPHTRSPAPSIAFQFHRQCIPRHLIRPPRSPLLPLHIPIQTLGFGEPRRCAFSCVWAAVSCVWPCASVLVLNPPQHCTKLASCTVPRREIVSIDDH